MCLSGTGPTMRALREDVEAAIASDATILITGEPGVGKKHIARLIHRKSQRRHSPLVTISCTDVSNEPTAVEVAHGGTLLVDQLGELDVQRQECLFRFLETGEVRFIAAGRSQYCVNVRVIATTNSDLRERLRKNQFREDLFYRLNVIHLMVPALRERRRDLAAIVHRLVREHAEAQGRTAGVSAEVVSRLVGYHWPGNAREFIEVLEQLAVSGRDRTIGIEDLPPHIREPQMHAPCRGLLPMCPE